MTVGTITPIDPNATRETVNLLRNLHALSGRAILFGHQDTTAYGVGWTGDPERSDIKSVCGEYPAVYGWDFGNPDQTDGPQQSLVQQRALEAYLRGGVNTFCWHMNNPVSGGSFCDLTPAVAQLLPGGTHHGVYRAELERVAAFANKISTADGTRVPIIFRPFHEHNGNWFWWCRPFCTDEEFVELWRFTVRMLRDELGVHQFLYAYSPDIFDGEAGYLNRYPGDEYVDVMGHDNYRQAEDPNRRAEFIAALRQVVEIAESRGKLPALTETGLDKIADPAWWTVGLADPIINDPVARRISWALVWRNAGTDHHFAPHPGHPSEADFRAMVSHRTILMEGSLPNLYTDNLT